MRQYSAAVYANENLLLSEVLERIESDLPTIGLSVYGGAPVEAEITTATGEEYTINPASRLGDEEILIVLSDPQADMEHLKKFDGTVIDFTGAFTDIAEEVYTIEDPIAYVLNSLVKDPADAEAVAFVPAAVFGKSGIDDLLNQTRELFTFSNAETKVFDQRLAFNMFFSDPDQGILSGYRQKLKQDTGIDVDVRMIAVSTGFVLDVYFKNNVKSNFISDSNSRFETLADLIGADTIVTLADTGRRLSLAGDYIHTVVRQITDALKDITGED